MNISVLIPSRGNPKELHSLLSNLENFADAPASVEFVLRLDSDDPALKGYSLMIDLKKHKTIIGDPLGYGGVHQYVEECYQLAEGDLLWLCNDDVECETVGWDTGYMAALEHIPFGVACSIVKETNGHNYPWCMPLISGDLCRAIGRFCLGEGPYDAYDRVVESYARQTGRWAQAEVRLHHKRTVLKKGSERERVESHVRSNWEQCSRRWDDCARRMLEATRIETR